MRLLSSGGDLDKRKVPIIDKGAIHSSNDSSLSVDLCGTNLTKTSSDGELYLIDARISEGDYAQLALINDQYHAPYMFYGPL